MKVLSVVSEIFPFIKTGGLADVAGSLPHALASHETDVVSLLPGYAGLLERLTDRQLVASWTDLLGFEATIFYARAHGLDLLVLDIPPLFQRPGGAYIDESGRDHADNWLRFAALSLAGARIGAGALPYFQPDVVHVHDWQTSLVPVYLRYGLNNEIPVALTIHNLAFQGQFSSGIAHRLELPPTAFGINCLEYYGDVGYLKGGIICSDVITTVSPTYAREILSPELGMGLDGVLQERRSVVYGIVNGIDDEIWSPSADPLLPRSFDIRSINRRATNRQVLLERFGLPMTGGPLFATVSRLTWQKGADLLIDAADEIIACGGQFVICGKGDPEIESDLTRLAAACPENIGVHVGYDEETAHLIIGGCDVLVQPSRFEPCGLTQLYAMRYGAIPLVSRTGGLSETIIDANDAATARDVATGFQFHPVDSRTLRAAIYRTCEAFQDNLSWRSLQRQAMKADFSWGRSAAQYAELFKALLAGRLQQPR